MKLAVIVYMVLYFLSQPSSSPVFPFWGEDMVLVQKTWVQFSCLMCTCS